MSNKAHARQHSVQVQLDKEVTEAPELSTFTELGCWVTRNFPQNPGKKSEKKWLRYRDYTLYWCKSPEVQQAEGCIRLLSDSVTLHPQGEKGIRLQCADKDRFFDFTTELDINRWYDRITKTLTIRAESGDNFRTTGNAVYSNTVTLYMLTNQKWVVAGKGDMKVMVDRSDCGGIPDVAAKINFPSDPNDPDNTEKAYSFLLYPYLKEKGGKTWIIPKVNDMNADFALQTLAFRFEDAEQSQVFHAMFDNIFRAVDIDTKEQTDDHMRTLQRENDDLKTENAQLREKLERLASKEDTLKGLLDKARARADKAEADAASLRRGGGGRGGPMAELAAAEKELGSLGSYSRQEAMAWDTGRVCEWLEEIGMGRYVSQFREYELDGSILVQDMTSDSLISDLRMPQRDALTITAAIAGFSAGGGGDVSTGPTSTLRSAFNSGAWKDTVRRAVQKKSGDIRTLIRRALGSGGETTELNDLKVKVMEFDRGNLVNSYDYQQTLDDARRQGREEQQDVEEKIFEIKNKLQLGVSCLSNWTTEQSETTREIRRMIDQRQSRISECERDVSSRKGSLKVRAPGGRKRW